jgi:hypothetical protein
MTGTEELNKIKTKGYWRILFEPLGENTISPFSKCKELMINNSVELRGWDYPHIPKRTGDDTAFEPGDNYWQAWLDWKEYAHFEFWRFYQSGQFIHFRAISQDWEENVVYKNMWEHDTPLRSGEFLGVVGTVFLFTEIFQFVSKLAAEGIYDDGVKITISLNNTEGRKLFVDSHGRVPFSSEKKTAAKTIERSAVYAKEELLNSPTQYARDFILYFFERFSWEPNPKMIQDDQEKLINRQI